MPLRTSSLEFISLTIVRRGVSTRMQPAPAMAVSRRGRPDSRLISPKNSPRPSRVRSAAARRLLEHHFAVDDREERGAELARLVDLLALADDAASRAAADPCSPASCAAHRIFCARLVHRRTCSDSLRSTSLSMISSRNASAVHLPEHRDQRLEALDHLVDVALERQAVELVLEQRMIRRLECRCR